MLPSEPRLVRLAEGPPRILGVGDTAAALGAHKLRPGVTTVGGAFDCDIRVSAPGLVCRLYNHVGDVTLAPATPFSPVLVDGEQVPVAVRLTPGALVTVGRCLMRFVPEGGPGSGEERKPPPAPRRSNTPSTRSPEPDSPTCNSQSVSPTVQPTKPLTSPSPAFNRNPSPFIQSNTPPLTKNHHNKISSTSSASSSPFRNKSNNSSMSPEELVEVLRIQDAQVDEIVAACTEYQWQQEQQLQQQRQLRLSPASSNGCRIKTNGSLPRNGLHHAWSDDDSSSWSADGGPSTGEPRPSSPVPPPSPGAPYENVMLVYPGSPRTRIRTIAPAREPEKRTGSSSSGGGEYEFLTSTPSPRSSAPPRQILPDIPSNDISDYNHHRMSEYELLGNGDADPNRRLMPRKLNNQNTAVVQARAEQRNIQQEIAKLKDYIRDLELQEVELNREADVERALLFGEVESLRKERDQEEIKIRQLKASVLELDEKLSSSRARELWRQTEYQHRLVEHELTLSSLHKEIKLCRNENLRVELKDKIENQEDLIEAEKKSQELAEFSALEEEAARSVFRDQTEKEAIDLEAQLETSQRRLNELERQRNQVALATASEVVSLQARRSDYLQRLQQETARLQLVESRLSSLGENDVNNSPDNTSDCDDMVDGVNGKDYGGILGAADQERISRVTATSPLDVTAGPPGIDGGRRTLESLIAIERKRHQHLAEQASQVIEEERKRVSAIKKRVQDEVRAQWEADRRFSINEEDANRNGISSDQHQRLSSMNEPQNNCDVSVHSLGSEPSTTLTTSSEFIPESGSSDEPLDPLRSVSSSASSKPSPNPESGAETSLEVLEKERELGRVLEEIRPLSDGAAYEHSQILSDPGVLSVKRRDTLSPSIKHQRPLTRYLPIRSGESLNLRQHVESAGHQVDLCQHVQLDASTCKGYLLKLGSRFHHWNRRWFVFDRSRRTFTYFADRSERKKRGGCYFQGIEEVYVDHLNAAKSPHTHLTFAVKTNERTLYLAAPSPEAMRIWVDVIFTGAEGYHEYLESGS